VWNLVLQGAQGQSFETPDPETVKELRHRTHKTIKKATEDYDRFRFNTMLAALMEFTNYLSKVREAESADSSSWQEAINALLLLLAPTAPHLAEELWGRTSHEYSIHNQILPRWDDELVREEEISLVVQVNGKVRGKCIVAADISEEDAREVALNQDNVKAHLQGKQIAKVIYVPGKLVNIVAR
jgi:leucyl-tRNA synthetase